MNARSDIRVIRVGNAVEIADLDWDTPFETTHYGTAHYVDEAPYVPEVVNDPQGDVEVYSDRWEALTGFTGQYGYNGAVMHSSEYMGGGLAKHLLANPGVYAITEVRDDDGQYPDQPIGWAVLHLKGDD